MAKSVRRRWVAAWGLALGGCFSGLPGVGTSGEAEISGALELSGPTFGATTLDVGGCASGEHQVFLGADFAGSGGLVARLAVDPITGPSVKIFESGAPFGKAIVIHQSACPGFHFSLERGGWQINDVYVLRVALDLDCTSASGDTVKGRIATSRCW